MRSEIDVDKINCWHSIHSSTLLNALREVEAGMPADGVYLALYEGAEHCEHFDEEEE
jgi:hypothetical protein